MTTLTALSKETDVITEANYAIAWNIARSKRPYTDGELMKEIFHKLHLYWTQVAKKMQCLISKIALSMQTTVRRIGELSANVKM